jgi:GNAT superfamily N-acetyltransferase
VDIVPVKTAKDLDRFIRYVYERYRNAPLWVPPLPDDEKVRLTPGKNPYFEHAEAAYFLAIDSGRVVGRIAATIDKNHDSFQGERQAAFGFFEAESAAATAALLNAAEAWGRAKGAQVFRGPWSFTTNDECGLLIQGFDVRPMLLMPWNAPEYQAWIEAAGMAKAKDLYAWRVPVPEQPQPVFQRIASMARKRDRITVRPLEMKKFGEELSRVKTVYNAAWERNWGFVPMTDHEIDHLAEQFRPIAIPELVPFAEKDGKVIAFGLALPDLNTALVGNRKGSLLPFALKALWLLKTRRQRRARILPEYRGKGIDAMLYHWIWTKSGDRQIYWGEAGWILEDNPAMNAGLEKMTFTVYKTYRLYERPL